MKNQIRLLITAFIYFFGDTVVSQGFIDLTQLSRCRSPLGEEGICLGIKQCTSLMDLLLRERHRPEVVNYLRSAVCGFERTDPKVCCTEIKDLSVLIGGQTTPKPSYKPPQDNNTPRPSVRPRPLIDETSILPRSGECGVSDGYIPRVVGGSDAKLGNWPWIAALGYRSTKNPGQPVFLCGGSLITDRHILTAAHCVYNRRNLYMVRLGDLNLYDDNDKANPIEIRIADTIIHQGYNPTTFVNDIAILVLESPVTYTKNIKPICLPVEPHWKTKDLNRRNMAIAGWGTVSFNGPSSNTLQQLFIPVVSENECKRAFETFKTAVIDDRVLCAGYLRGGKDACKGDSGGPLMDVHDGIYYQFGVVSYGYKCAEPGFPGVYTKVTTFSDWILENLSR